MTDYINKEVSEAEYDSKYKSRINCKIFTIGDNSTLRFYIGFRTDITVKQIANAIKNVGFGVVCIGINFNNIITGSFYPNNESSSIFLYENGLNDFTIPSVVGPLTVSLQEIH
jgi:hypothetical protein